MPSYIDKKTGKVFEMEEKAFNRFMVKKKHGNAPRYAAYQGLKKKESPTIPAPPPPTKQEQAAELINDQLKGLTARQLIAEITTMEDLEQLQALQHDARKTVAAAAVQRLAGLVEDQSEGGEQ